MNKKIMVLFVSILLFSSFATVAHAGIMDELGDLFGEVSNKFGRSKANLQDADTGIPIYDNNKNFIDFTVMFILFLSLSYLGLKKAMGDQGGNAVKGLSIAVGIALAIAAMKAGISPGFFIPFVKNALFLIIFMVIFFMLKQMLPEGNVVWALILALIITWAAFNVFNVVLDEDKKFDIGNLLGTPTATKLENLNADRNLVADNIAELAIKYKVDRSQYKGDVPGLAEAVRQAILTEMGAVQDQPNPEEALNKLRADRQKLNDLLIQFNTIKNDISNEGLKLQASTPSGVAITPSQPGPLDNLVCRTSGSSHKAKDPTVYVGEIGYEFRWFKNNDKDAIKIDTASISPESTLPSLLTTEGDKITCKVTAIVRGQPSKAGQTTVTIRSNIRSDIRGDTNTIITNAENVAGNAAASRDQIEAALTQLVSIKPYVTDTDTRDKVNALIGRLTLQLGNNRPKIILRTANNNPPYDESKNLGTASISSTVIGRTAGINKELVIEARDGGSTAGSSVSHNAKQALESTETITITFKVKGIYDVFIRANDGVSPSIESKKVRLNVGAEIDQLLDSLDDDKDLKDESIDKLLEELAK